MAIIEYHKGKPYLLGAGYHKKEGIIHSLKRVMYRGGQVWPDERSFTFETIQSGGAISVNVGSSYGYVAAIVDDTYLYINGPGETFNEVRPAKYPDDEYAAPDFLKDNSRSATISGVNDRNGNDVLSPSMTECVIPLQPRSSIIIDTLGSTLDNYQGDEQTGEINVKVNFQQLYGYDIDTFDTISVTVNDVHPVYKNEPYDNPQIPFIKIVDDQTSPTTTTYTQETKTHIPGKTTEFNFRNIYASIRAKRDGVSQGINVNNKLITVQITYKDLNGNVVTKTIQHSVYINGSGLPGDREVIMLNPDSTTITEVNLSKDILQNGNDDGLFAIPSKDDLPTNSSGETDLFFNTSSLPFYDLGALRNTATIIGVQKSESRRIKKSELPNDWSPFRHKIELIPLNQTQVFEILNDEEPFALDFKRVGDTSKVDGRTDEYGNPAPPVYIYKMKIEHPGSSRYEPLCAFPLKIQSNRLTLAAGTSDPMNVDLTMSSRPYASFHFRFVSDELGAVNELYYRYAYRNAEGDITRDYGVGWQYFGTPSQGTYAHREFDIVPKRSQGNGGENITKLLDPKFADQYNEDIYDAGVMYISGGWATVGRHHPGTPVYFSEPSQIADIPLRDDNGIRNRAPILYHVNIINGLNAIGLSNYDPDLGSMYPASTKFIRITDSTEPTQGELDGTEDLGRFVHGAPDDTYEANLADDLVDASVGKFFIEDSTPKARPTLAADIFSVEFGPERQDVFNIRALNEPQLRYIQIKHREVSQNVEENGPVEIGKNVYITSLGMKELHPGRITTGENILQVSNCPQFIQAVGGEYELEYRFNIPNAPKISVFDSNLWTTAAGMHSSSDLGALSYRTYQRLIDLSARKVMRAMIYLSRINFILEANSLGTTGQSLHGLNVGLLNGTTLNPKKHVRRIPPHSGSLTAPGFDWLSQLEIVDEDFGSDGVTKKYFVKNYEDGARPEATIPKQNADNRVGYYEKWNSLSPGLQQYGYIGARFAEARSIRQSGTKNGEGAKALARICLAPVAMYKRNARSERPDLFRGLPDTGFDEEHFLGYGFGNVKRTVATSNAKFGNSKIGTETFDMGSATAPISLRAAAGNGINADIGSMVEFWSYTDNQNRRVFKDSADSGYDPDLFLPITDVSNNINNSTFQKINNKLYFQWENQSSTLDNSAFTVTTRVAPDNIVRSVKSKTLHSVSRANNLLAGNILATDYSPSTDITRRLTTLGGISFLEYGEQGGRYEKQYGSWSYMKIHRRERIPIWDDPNPEYDYDADYAADTSDNLPEGGSREPPPDDPDRPPDRYEFATDKRRVTNRSGSYTYFTKNYGGKINNVRLVYSDQ